MTPAKVTLTLLLEEQRQGKALYSPVPGTAYEIAPGASVVLKVPVFGLQETFFEKVASLEHVGEGATLRAVLEANADVARLVTEGAWPEGPDMLIGNVVQRILVDFMSASGLITRPATLTSDAYAPLIDQLLSRLSGQDNGLIAAEDAER